MQTPTMNAARVKPTTRPIMRLVLVPEFERRCIEEKTFFVIVEMATRGCFASSV